MMSVAPFGDSAFFVSSEQLAGHVPLADSPIHTYDPVTGRETIEEGALDLNLAAANQAAFDAGFDGLKGLLHELQPQSEDEGAEFIFGADDRQLVTNTLAWPYTAIGRLWMRTGASEASCTGVMIDSYHVLTAGHCVNGVNGGGWADQIVFSAAQDRTQLYDATANTTFRRSELQFYGEANWTYVRSYVAWTQSDDWDFDLAVVTLDRRLGNFTGWFGYGYTTDSNYYSSNTATTAGYPADRTPSVYDMWTDSGNTVNYAITTNQFRTTDLDIWPGQSGSPVWFNGPSTHGVVSYQSYTDSNGNGQWDPGEPQLYNGFMRLTSAKFNDIGAWRTEDDGVRPPTDRADLVNYDDWFNTTSAFMNSTFTTPGGNFSVTCFPRNNGTAATGNYTVSYYASTNSTISTSDYFLGSVGLGSLAPFDYANSALSTTFPNIPTGSYYIGWIIDAGNSVGEFLEGNNTGYVKSGLLTVGTDDHGNNAGTATRILADSVTPGNLETAGDKDWFFFEASPGANVTLTTSLGSLADTVLRLYDSDGVTELAFNDDYAGSGLASRIDYTLAAQGAYYVSVEDYGNNDLGTYSLTLTHLDDHGDDTSSGSLIGAHSLTAGNLEVGGDVDSFYFYALGGTQITATTTLGTLGDSVLRMYDAFGNQIAFDDDGGPGLASQIAYTIPNDSYYYVTVEDYGVPNPGSYSLSLEHVDDHSDSWPSASPLAANASQAGSIEVNYDQDYFRFLAVAGATYRIETQLISLGDSVLWLYDTDGTTPLVYDDDGGTGLASRIDWTAPADGTYFIDVAGYSVSFGTYTLDIGNSEINGDFNGDGAFDCFDIDALVAAIAAGGNDPTYDMSGDGLVDIIDRDAWLVAAGAANLPSGAPYLLGDATLNGVVDVSDFNAWNAHKFTTSPSWCNGDFTANGVVDVSDFNIWNTHKFTASAAFNRPAAAVSKPTPRFASRDGVWAESSRQASKSGADRGLFVPSLAINREFSRHSSRRNEPSFSEGQAANRALDTVMTEWDSEWKTPLS